MKKRLLSSTLLLVALFVLSSGNIFGQRSIKSTNKGPINERMSHSKFTTIKDAAKSDSNIKQQKRTAKTVSPNASNSIKKIAADVTVPYFQDFETGLPLTDLGWTVISGGKGKDMNVFLGTGYFDSFFFLGSPYDASNKRNEWAVSPGVVLEAGKTYKFEVMGMLVGWDDLKEEFKVAVGTSPTAAALTTVIIDKTGENGVAEEDWIKYTGKFTPTVNGTYYFGINVCSPADANLVSFDNVFIAEENAIAPPLANVYTKGGLWAEDIEAGVVFLSRNQSVSHTFISENVNSFSWTFTGDANPATSDKATTSVVYQNEGVHDITLNIGGADGSTTNVQSSFDLVRPFGFNEFAGNRKPHDALSDNSYVGGYGFLFGPTNYYGAVAEKFELPSNATAKISALSYYVEIYNITAANQALKCPIYIFNDVDGQPGEVLAAFTDATFADVFGTDPAEGVAFELTFAPIDVTGSFYVVFDFSNLMQDANNYLGLYVTNPRKYEDCTSYFYYESEQGYAWIPMNELWLNGEFSACIFPQIEWTNDESGIKESLTDDSNIKVSTLKNTITVDGAEDLNVSVVTLDGKIIYNNIAKGSINIPVAQQGVYIVKTGSKVTKVIVK